ncbi:hypothetical protein IMZ48_36470, partial [Candidatus Bathyarchaeota archaeon]|nr:hypothetical protein [Candidatus Bathyarchaeota archaeon]
MCDYVDAGNGKECSDEKVKGKWISTNPRMAGVKHPLSGADKDAAVFKSSVADARCQRIYFGGSADNGYARLLGPYLETQGVRERVCLLEGPPFAQELADIKDRFGTASFNDVFRTQKLPTLLKRRVPSPATTPPISPSTGYAAVASRLASDPPPTGQAGP